MNKFYVVILIYNSTINESITCKKIRDINLKNINVIILDNSTKITNNKKEAKEYGYDYISMNGNKGISIPYNKAINYILKEKKASYNDYIIWLDDDTELTKEYFDVLMQSVKLQKDIDIFAPIIYGQDGVIYSPNEARFIKNKLISNKKEAFNLKKYNAINSCLCVKLEVYKNYRYDEVLFLDQTDQNFFDDMRILNKKFMTLNVIINQNFSQRGNNLNPQKMLIRYELRVKDIMRYGRKSLIKSCKSLVKACGLSLQMGLKCKYPKIIYKCSFISLCFFINNIKSLILGRVK